MKLETPDVLRLSFTQILKIWNSVFWPSPRAETYVVEDGKLLVIKNGKTLLLPGGRLKTNETFKEAARRETREETGLKVDLKSRRKCYNNQINDIVVQFKAKPKEDFTSLSGSWEGTPKWIRTDKIEEYELNFER